MDLIIKRDLVDLSVSPLILKFVLIFSTCNPYLTKPNLKLALKKGALGGDVVKSTRSLERYDAKYL